MSDRLSYGSADERGDTITSIRSASPAAEMTEQFNASYEGPKRSDDGEDDGEKKYFTVDDAIEHIGFGIFQIKLSIFTGMIWMVDAMEVMIMSIISPAARCYFDLNDSEVAMISVVVFIGVMLGAPVWGVLTDKYGRHKCLLVSSAFTGLYGVASAFAPTYFWLLALRFLAGFNIAATSQAMTYYSEFLPSKNRGTCIVFVEVFWSVGTVFEAVLAMAVMPTLGWRYLLGFSAIPVTVSMLVFMFFPETPHFLMTVGETDKALKVLKRVAASNGKTMLSGQLVSRAVKDRIERSRNIGTMAEASGDGNLQEEEKEDGSDTRVAVVTNAATAGQHTADDDKLSGYLSSDAENDPLFYEVNSAVSGESDTEQSVETGKQKKGETVSLLGGCKLLFSSRKVGISTLLLGVIWFVLSFVYYGIALMTVEVLTVDLVVNGTCIDKIDSDTIVKCALTFDDYITTIWTTAAEFPGLVITVILLYLLSRRNAIRLMFTGVTIFFGLLLICNISRITMLLFIFGVRALITGVFQAVYVYTPEVYPTKIRGFALSICSLMSRFGAISTPFVAEVVLRQSLFKGKLIYTSVAAIGIVASVLLPIETKGIALGS